MFILELILLSVLLGIPLGIGLRIWDEWQEKNKAQEIEQKSNEALGWGERNKGLPGVEPNWYPPTPPQE
jgi:hypothetical protein